MRLSRSERGYTMLETIAYIGILGMLGALLASYAADAFGRYKTGRISQQILDLKKAVVNYTAADEDYETALSKLTPEGTDEQSLKIKEAAVKNLFPLDMRDQRHALGGRIVVEPVDGNRFMFSVTFEDINKKACMEVLSQGQFYRDGAELDAVVVTGENNNTTIWYYDNSFFSHEGYTTTYLMSKNSEANKNLRPSMTQIVGACSSPTRNHITWIFS